MTQDEIIEMARQSGWPDWEIVGMKGELKNFAKLVAAATYKESKAIECEPQPAVTEDGFSNWVCPKPIGYLMQCCDCGLIHEAEFRVAKYKEEGSDEFDVVGDANFQAQFRMRRFEA